MHSCSRFTLAALAALTSASGVVGAADLREAAPNDVYLATYHRHNPERDYQNVYYQDIWNTVQETKIFDKILTVIRRRIPENDREQFEGIRETLLKAMEPVKWDALSNCTESLYVQKMQAPVSQHIVMIRFGDGGSQSLVEALTNLMRLAESASGGDVPVQKIMVADAEFTTLKLPAEVPFQPMVGTVDKNVFVFATSQPMLAESLTLLNNPSAVSKFDDPRIIAAAAQLPAMEDGITVFDGKVLFSQLRELKTFIQTVSRGDAGAVRVAGLLDEVFSQVDLLDYEVTVEYTQDFQNRSASLGKVRDGAKSTVVGKMVANQTAFEDWDRWVPADATSYSLSTGANLHPLYEWLMELIPRTFPEASEGIAQFEAIQDQIDIHLDADILQAFSGESVSVTFPGTSPTPFGQSSQSVSFMRCSKPDRIMELIHRGIDKLNEIPQVRSQGLALREHPDMEGFEQLSAGIFGMLGIQPVIGSHDGWLVFGSHGTAVEKVLDTRNGDGDTIADSDTFRKFELEISGPVNSVSYSNTGEATRQMAAGLQQAGAMLPMILGMAGDPEAMVPTFLPSAMSWRFCRASAELWASLTLWNDS